MSRHSKSHTLSGPETLNPKTLTQKTRNSNSKNPGNWGFTPGMWVFLVVSRLEFRVPGVWGSFLPGSVFGSFPDLPALSLSPRLVLSWDLFPTCLPCLGLFAPGCCFGFCSAHEPRTPCRGLPASLCPDPCTPGKKKQSTPPSRFSCLPGAVVTSVAIDCPVCLPRVSRQQCGGPLPACRAAVPLEKTQRGFRGLSNPFPLTGTVFVVSFRGLRRSLSRCPAFFATLAGR